MNETLSKLRIDASRLQANFNALAEIGSTGDGGVHRPALSEAHLAAREWFRQKVLAAGLEFKTDGAGNHSAFLACAGPGAPTLLLGSHLDSVPYGGRFDGALGVLAGLETLQTVKEAGLSMPVNLEAIDFTDEEGTLVGLLGSAALAGKLTLADLQNPRGGREALLAGLTRAGLNEASLLSARRDPRTLAGYLEVHIEQGLRLLQSGADIGLVTTITGIASYRLTFTGRAGHAGTTSMEDRLDAAQGACTFTLAARQIVMDSFPGCVANVGAMSFSPGAFNIVPERARLALEFRAPLAADLEQLEQALLSRAEAEARRFRLGLEREHLGSHPPTPLSRRAREACAAAAADLGLPAIELASMAGHDAQPLAELCPAGMIFVPSVGGVSHSPNEFTDWEDCANGTNVLLQAALRMAGAVG